VRIRFYFDEDVPIPLARALRQRGVDVLTTQEAAMSHAPDAEQMAFAVAYQRAFLTHNKRDFVLIHQAYLQKREDHWGIVVADQNKVGPLLRMLSKLWFTLPSEKMKNRIEFLGNWK
jgi:hypothetical protein